MSSFLRKYTILFVSFSLSFTTIVGLHLANLTAQAQQTQEGEADPVSTASDSELVNTNKDAEMTEAVGQPAETLATTFTDVHEENYHYVPILKLAEEGIISGYEDGTFHSYETINRAEALKIILEAFDEFSEEEYTEPEKRPFQDVPLSSWFAKYIVTAKNKEIISGYEDETFHPNKTINLAEALKMIEQSLDNYIPQLPTEDLSADVSMNDWFAEYVQYAINREMLNINDDNQIFPGQEMTRGYFTEIIYKLKYFWEEYHFGRATFYGAAVQGNNTASGRTFDMYEMTAAHKTLPFGTIVEVTNLANGKSVQVEITDRGPYGPGRVIDLTTAAFEKIAETHRGVINVQFKIVPQPTE